MRRFTALALAVCAVLITACGRQPMHAETTNATASQNASDDVQIVLPETTQTVSETQKPSETETAPTTAQPPVTTTPERTTQPPETTTQRSSDTDNDFERQPPESGSAPFTAKYIRIYRSYEDYFTPTAVVAENREQLDDALRSAANENQTDVVPPDDVAAYTDEWFCTHRLIVITLQESSGSYRHNVRKVTYTDDGAAIKISRSHPSVCTCDIAHWILFIELPDTRMHGGDPVELMLK